MLESAIIPRSLEWQKALADIITDPRELFNCLELDTAYLEHAYQVCKIFPLRVPRSFVAKMRKRDFADPLLRQVLPLEAELSELQNFSADPLQEQQQNPLPGLLHKYKNRVLLIISGICTINCRFCFRRHFAYSDNNPGRAGLKQVYAYLREHSEINEVILSGGDPLIAPDNFLKDIAAELAAIPHIQRLRIHSRIPIVTPTRINEEFIDWFSGTRLQPVLVAHCNHAREIDQEVMDVMTELRKKQITLLNQSVLLKGVNDDVAILKDLSEALFAAGVLPYYLHLLDKVSGTAHFEVAEDRALSLINELRKQLPGYLVPKLVREDPWAGAKREVF